MSKFQKETTISKKERNVSETADSEAHELFRQYIQFCSECPKAHDFTCSGADVAACEAKKQSLLEKLKNISAKERKEESQL